MSYLTFIPNLLPIVTLCVATKSYKSTKMDEISVEIGSVVEAVRKSNDGWWLVR